MDQLAQATGGESLFNGTIPPVAFEPFLKTFAKDISESYVMGFRASANNEKRDTLTRIKVKSNDKGVKVYAPENVHPGRSGCSRVTASTQQSKSPGFSGAFAVCIISKVDWEC